MRPIHRQQVSRFAVLAGVLALLLPAWAAWAELPRSELAARGKVTYRVYCSNCHGGTGVGNGPLASLLKTAPSDLTQLAAHNQGKYAPEEVRRKIDGRDSVAAHGYGDMPVWGLSFQNLEKGGDQEPEVAAKLDYLVAFLETLQTPAKP